MHRCLRLLVDQITTHDHIPPSWRHDTIEKLRRGGIEIAQPSKKLRSASPPPYMFQSLSPSSSHPVASGPPKPSGVGNSPPQPSGTTWRMPTSMHLPNYGPPPLHRQDPMGDTSLSSSMVIEDLMHTGPAGPGSMEDVAMVQKRMKVVKRNGLLHLSLGMPMQYNRTITSPTGSPRCGRC